MILMISLYFFQYPLNMLITEQAKDIFQRLFCQILLISANIFSKV